MSEGLFILLVERSFSNSPEIGADKKGPTPRPSTKMEVRRVLLILSVDPKRRAIEVAAGAGMDEAAVDTKAWSKTERGERQEYSSVSRMFFLEILEEQEAEGVGSERRRGGSKEEEG